MNAITLNRIEIAGARQKARDEVLADFVERVQSGKVLTGEAGLNNQHAHETIFDGELLEVSYLSNTWIPITDYVALVSFFAMERASPKWLIERILNGEIVRVAELYIRKTPEAHRGLSQSPL
jgi:hypothetical protein